METPFIGKGWLSTPLGCTNEGACNYEPLAETDNGTCVLVGDSCDDGNPSTLNDVINADCLCGEEVDLLGEMDAAELPSLGPNPAAYDLSVKADHPLGNVRVLDLQGKVCTNEFKTWCLMYLVLRQALIC